MVCRYAGGGVPWGITVPMMDTAARPISRKMVSFSEQKKFHREFTKPLFVDFKKTLLRERIRNHGKNIFNSIVKKVFLPVWLF